MRVVHVVGARPNFMKLAPCHRALRGRQGIEQAIIHTGQHYDDSLSGSFFEELGIPSPDANLEVGSGSHAQQTARIIERIEPALLQLEPSWVVVYGDVNSTAAAAIVASKLRLKIAHVEAGLRSRDRSMPEEVNRLITDRIADLLLTPSRDAEENLAAEGVDPRSIRFVGNVMVDTLLHAQPRAEALGFRRELGLAPDGYALVTLHRPSNVDVPQRLESIASALGRIAKRIPVIFPVHPRTKARFGRSVQDLLRGVRMLDPIPYHAMLDLTAGARVVITDSGGLQEETTALRVWCLTLRENTERPVTVTEGTNRLVHDPSSLETLVFESDDRVRPDRRPEGWDGHAGERIADALCGWGAPLK